MNFNLVTIRPRGFPHASASAEVKDSVAWALAALGHSVMLTENTFSASRAQNVIFHAELLSVDSALPPNSIVYNLESQAHPNFANLLPFLGKQKATVWDYSLSNLEPWRKAGVEVHHVPVGFTPNLVRLPQGPVEYEWDAFFVGWMTSRRHAIIDKLREVGLKVFASDSCYGGARDYVLSRSRIALNIHHDGRTATEIVRISYYLANCKCVVSEIGSDDADYLWLTPASLLCSYNDVVKRVTELLDHEEVIDCFANDGRKAIEKLDYVETLRKVVGSSPYNKEVTKVTPSAFQLNQSPPTTNGYLLKIKDRYKRGVEEGDMKDFLPFLRSLAKGKMLEIGVRDGASTSAFLLGYDDKSDHDGLLTSVDVTDCSGLWEHPQWNFLQTSSLKLDCDPGCFDLALIDGDHSPNVFRADLENCLRWVRPGGVILCHDIAPDGGCTQEAAGGDWPSKFVGEIFWQVCRQKSLRHFQFPGRWGLGVILV